MSPSYSSAQPFKSYKYPGGGNTGTLSRKLFQSSTKNYNSSNAKRGGAESNPEEISNIPMVLSIQKRESGETAFLQ